MMDELNPETDLFYSQMQGGSHGTVGFHGGS